MIKTTSQNGQGRLARWKTERGNVLIEVDHSFLIDTRLLCRTSIVGAFEVMSIDQAKEYHATLGEAIAQAEEWQK